MRQTWNDLLFAHWPIASEKIVPLLPPGLELDTFEGSAWLGVVPFWMNQVRHRVVGSRTVFVPGARAFSELNLRTYVRSPRTGRRGVFFFSLDCSSPLAVVGARTLFHLPYFFAAIRRHQENGLIHYESRRLAARSPVRFSASYRPVGPVQRRIPGSLTEFLTERYCLFTPHRGRILVGEIHHLPWPLQPAEAEICLDEIPAAHRLTLPATPPVLHFSLRLEVFLWSLRPDVQSNR